MGWCGAHNLPLFLSIHNLPRSSAHQKVHYDVAVPHTLSDIYSLEQVLSHVLPPFDQQVDSCIKIAVPTTRRIGGVEKDKAYHGCSSTIDQISANAPTVPQTSGIPYSCPITPLSPANVLEGFCDDYPLVKFWHKSDWTAFQKKEKSKLMDPTKGDTQKDSMAWYIEDENREPMSATTLKEIQETA